MTLSQTRRLLLPLIILALAAVNPPAWSFDRANLQQAVLDSKVLSGQNFQIAEKDNAPLVIAPLSSSDFSGADAEKAVARSAKLKGVLIAKTIMDKAKDVAAVYFDFRYGNRSWQLVVRAGDISGYASGTLSQERLLDSIAVQTNTPQRAVAPKAPVTSSVCDFGHIQYYQLPAPEFHSDERQNHLTALQILCRRPDLPQNQLRFLVSEFGKEEALAQRHSYTQWIDQFNKFTQMLDQMTETANKLAQTAHVIRSVKPGAYEPEREGLRREIEELRRKGQDVSRLTVKFDAIESTVDSAPPDFTHSMMQSLQAEINSHRGH